MRISELLLSIASWLESPENEAILLSEYDDSCMKVVANSLVEAAHVIKKGAAEVDALEPVEPSGLTPESLEILAGMANNLDSKDDPDFRKLASVLDELLLTIATPPNAYKEKLAASDARLDDLRKKYQDNAKALEDVNKIADVRKIIEKSPMIEEYRILEAPLQSRYCPDHSGAQMSRIGESLWQCSLDKKTYNYETGYQLDDGRKVPGGSVANQNQNLTPDSHSIFDTREDRLQSNKP